MTVAPKTSMREGSPVLIRKGSTKRLWSTMGTRMVPIDAAVQHHHFGITSFNTMDGFTLCRVEDGQYCKFKTDELIPL